jgi:DNA-binding MarR family transcriptional regulator
MHHNELVELLAESMSKIRRAHKTMRTHFDDEALPLYLLMDVHAIAKNGHVPISAVKDALGVTAAAATQFIKRLEKHGYIERTSDPNDKRVTLISLNTKGKAAVKRTEKQYLQIMQTLITELGEDDSAHLIRLLNKTMVILERKPEHE